ncbi:peptidase U32 family protein [Limnoraphis robusta]|uniref:Peptidase U32 family protein n=1 Tax=Limnoraphis robusta CCNP1315 TaxID=3110306 RepID=A0ABU5U229_9CYAN|nr:peptidase U32 family protein [Limnoraphis robusta]MEA5521251.1 peptidase U32 family protein [Limnoraphis robusta CCNP1315]MEA5545472.1 peptidase U32 family protein [Limnoraphis robusta CCNP1324]
MITKWKPELLAPAKNLERLKVAILYGADAVYVGGQNYGLRARADNFTDYDLQQGAEFSHQYNAQLYVTLNAFLHDADFDGLGDYCQFLESIGIDAVIVSDLGVLRVVRKSSNLNIHLSTQASCLNSSAAELWKQFGVKRLIVGRELSIAETGLIGEKCGIDVEMFIHGAMCMAYSGHCTISNFTAGRDSNRGGCIQSCRLPYKLENQEENPITFMSSKDLWGVHQIAEFFQHKICSLKIEGRMKSSFYVAMTCKAYRQLIDAYVEGTVTPELIDKIEKNLESIPHRDYSSGSLENPADSDSVFGQLSGNNRGTHEYLGIVIDSTSDVLAIQLLEPLKVGDEIDIIPPQGEIINWKITQLFSVRGERLDSIQKDSVVCIPKVNILQNITKLTVIRLAQQNTLVQAELVTYS